jgi:hypothetical protein
VPVIRLADPAGLRDVRRLPGRVISAPAPQAVRKRPPAPPDPPRGRSAARRTLGSPGAPSRSRSHRRGRGREGGGRGGVRREPPEARPRDGGGGPSHLLDGHVMDASAGARRLTIRMCGPPQASSAILGSTHTLDWLVERALRRTEKIAKALVAALDELEGAVVEFRLATSACPPRAWSAVSGCISDARFGTSSTQVFAPGRWCGMLP